MALSGSLQIPEKSRMSRAARWLLLVVGVLLVLSAAAHALLGWPAIRAALLTSQAQGDVTQDVGIGWLYGSAAMLTFGVITLTVWWSARAGKVLSVAITAPISLLYLGFGTWAFVHSSLNPHFIGFIILGALLAVASYGLRCRT